MQRIRAPRSWREARREVRQPNEPSQPRRLQPQPRPVEPQSQSVTQESLTEQPPLLRPQPRPLRPAGAGLVRPQRAEPRLLLRPPGPAPSLLSGPSGAQDVSQQHHAPRSPPWEGVSVRSSRAHRQSPVLPARHGQSLRVLR